jgi:hypothetical protein
MTHSQIATALLSKQNVSLYIKCVWGYEFIEDLHKYVKTDLLIISQIKDPKNSERALILKERLLYLLENYDSIEKHIIGWKPKKRR